MIKIQILVCAMTMAFAYSCNCIEEIHINGDGSGKLSINFDGSELMQMSGEEMTGKNEKPIESEISLKDLLEEKKDSIAQLAPEEQAKLKKMEPFYMYILMNFEEKLMKFDLFGEFKDVSEVNDAFNAFERANTLNYGVDHKKYTPIGMLGTTTEVSYKFSGNNFSRKATIIDEEMFQHGLDSLQKSEIILSRSTYTLKYHFPRKVKSTTAKGATFSADGKTLIYEVPFLDLMKEPNILDLEVQLED